MTTPRLSVLMTVHNGGRFLAAAVDSVLGQTWTDFECLIRDDGSTDDTPAQLRAYAARDPRLQVWLDQPRLGLVRSMNQLFPRARGQFVTRHDADDLSLPDRFARQIAFLDAHPDVGVVGCGVEVVDAAGQPVPAGFFIQATTDAELRTGLLAGGNLCQGSVMMRRACLEQVGYYDEALEQAEDYDLWLRLAEITQLACLEQKLYQYRQHAGGVTKQRYFRALLDKAAVLERAWARRTPGSLPASQRQYLAARYLEGGLEALAAGEGQVARASLRHAQALHPASLAECADGAVELLRRWFDKYPLVQPVGTGLALVEAAFAALPPSRALRRQRSRLLAQLHLREVFSLAGQADVGRLRPHLLAGLRHDPTWLLNRGVLALLARSLRGRST